MSKTPPTAATTTSDAKVGDVVLAKVKGFSAWPAVVSTGPDVLRLSLTILVLFPSNVHKTTKTRVEMTFISSLAP